MDSPIDIFAAGARDGVYPGAQLCASRQCKRMVTASVGVLSPGIDAVTDDTIYDVASLTKPLATTILVGRAMESGQMALDDPVSKFVPGIDARIRIEHLLDHSSGYPAHIRFDQALPKGLTPGSWDAWRHVVFAAANTPRENAPGMEAIYSDIGFILLGAALEVALAKPLSIAHALLGTPLFYRDQRGPPALPPVRPIHPIAPTEDCAPGQVHDENARVMGGAAGHAGLFGTAEGVLQIAEQLVLAYHGFKGGILQPDTIRKLWQPSLVEGSTRTLGWDRPSKARSSTGGRWPPQSVGHLGFTGTSLWIEPDRALIVALVSNRVHPSRANNMIRRLRPALHDAAWQHWGRVRPKSIKPVVRPLGVSPIPDHGDDQTEPPLDQTRRIQIKPRRATPKRQGKTKTSAKATKSAGPSRRKRAVPRSGASVRKAPAAKLEDPEDTTDPLVKPQRRRKATRQRKR